MTLLTEYEKLSLLYLEQLRRFAEHRERPDAFVQHLLCGNLIGCVACAEPKDRPLLCVYISWMVENIPRETWGSSERFFNWLDGEEDGR